MFVKVCGMRDGLNIRQVAELKPELLGFIFYPVSKRYVGADFDKSLLPPSDSNIRPVAVFVNEKLEEVQRIIEHYGFKTVQFHGSESPEYCAHFKKRDIIVFKAFGLHAAFNWEILTPYQLVCDYFLFDTSTTGYGGSGEKFEWELLDHYPLEHPFILSGGIRVEDSRQIRTIKHRWLAGVDINSRFELSPGVKNVDLVKKFMKSLNETI